MFPLLQFFEFHVGDLRFRLHLPVGTGCLTATRAFTLVYLYLLERHVFADILGEYLLFLCLLLSLTAISTLTLTELPRCLLETAPQIVGGSEYPQQRHQYHHQQQKE